MAILYRRFLMLTSVALFAGCSIAPVMDTTNPTLLPVQSLTPIPIPTLPLVRSEIPIPFSSPSPTFTETPYILNTLQPTHSPSPTIMLTKSTPCEDDYECVISNDGKWAADGYGKMFPGAIYAKDLPFLRIYKADGTIVHVIFCQEEDASGARLMYHPRNFDRTNQWLFAALILDGFVDPFDFIAPLTYGFVRINVQTGQMVPMLGIGSYYSVHFSPDESLFAYTMKQALGILNMKSGQHILIALKYKATVGITWKPDGSRFMVAASMDANSKKNWDILLITPGDPQPVQVLESFPDLSRAVDYMDNKIW